MKQLLLLIFLAVSFLVNAQNIEVNETFPNITARTGTATYKSGTNYQPDGIHNIEWNLRIGAADTLPNDPNNPSILVPYRGSTLNGVDDATPVNAGYTTNSDTGYLADASSCNIKIFYTTPSKGITISRSGKEVYGVKWVTANSSTFWGARVVFQIANNNWFVYDTATQKQAVANSGTDGNAFSQATGVYQWNVVFDMNGNNWYPLTHIPGTPSSPGNLSVGATAQKLPPGDITAWGLLWTRGSVNTGETRVDTYRILTKSTSQRRAQLIL